MDGLPPTIIKKNHKVATLAATSTPTTFDLDTPPIDSLSINDMMHDIEMLDEEAHAQIYLLLRGFKQASFFTTDRAGGGTHFDRTLLTARQLNELVRTVQLCKENMERNQIIKSAQHEMEQEASNAMSKFSSEGV
jgi:hypothetical protein